MKKIVDYNILEASDKLTLSLKVLADIKHGWQPYGDTNIICVTGIGTYVKGTISAWKYSQTMVKYKDVQPTAIIHIDENMSEQAFEEIREKLHEKNIT